MSSVASWQAVSKRYRGVTAVEGVSLALEAGEVTALVGHNGAGTVVLPVPEAGAEINRPGGIIQGT